jgi:hypothetical protein
LLEPFECRDLRGLRVADAPCTTLYEPRDAGEEEERGARVGRPGEAARCGAGAPGTTVPATWVTAQVWVATPLSRRGRLQISAQEIDDWCNAVNTVSGAADRLYGLLTKNQFLRRWVTDDYFSPFTLHQRLRDRVSAILDIVRDSPLQPDDSNTTEDGQAAAGLIRLTLELLHAYTGDVALRERLRDALLALLPARVRDRIGDQIAVHVQRLEFTLVLAALHTRLDFVTGLWPVVEAELNLDVTSNVLSRRPPQDYEPFTLESPMGNVLGFQFRPDEASESGSLSFFRCSGVGRELLLGLHTMPHEVTSPRRRPVEVRTPSAGCRRHWSACGRAR